MRVLMCGSRGWHNAGAIETVISGLTAQSEDSAKRLTIIHGDSKKGADGLVDRIARQWGARVIPVPAQWGRYHAGAGPIRNQQMLDEYVPEQVWAFRATGKSNGTDDMVTRSKCAGLPTFVVTEA